MSAVLKIGTSVIVDIEKLPWLPFGSDFCEGDIEWKLVYTQPGDDRWTVLFRGKKGAFIHSHIHTGEAEGVMIYGALGGPMSEELKIEPTTGLAWVREGAGAHHPRMKFLADTCFSLTMIGPIRWIQTDGKTVDTSAADAQARWDKQIADHEAAKSH